jgi:CheY-like chemotaxis protein/predicted RNA binding protein YcfA (HicA-like mRNA interferase family)
MEKSAIKSIYTTHDLSRLLHVNPRSVINWIEQDLLQSFRTPGGHRRVRHEDLIAFLRKHKIPMPASLTSGTFNILVVENEDGVAKTIESGLAAENSYVVSNARDGINALIAVGRNRPDLIILDLGIPGVDALEVCRQIKADPANQTVVLAISGESGMEASAKAAGADAFLVKPMETAALLDKMHKLLQVM